MTPVAITHDDQNIDRARDREPRSGRRRPRGRAAARVSCPGRAAPVGSRPLGLGETDLEAIEFPKLSLDEAIGIFTERAYGRALSFEHA